MGRTVDWIRAHVEPVGAIETAHERPWATVRRVPLAGGVAWFKVCASVQAFEPRLSAELFSRWPDRAPTCSATTRSERGSRSPTRYADRDLRQPSRGVARCAGPGRGA